MGFRLRSPRILSRAARSVSRVAKSASRAVGGVGKAAGGMAKGVGGVMPKMSGMLGGARGGAPAGLEMMRERAAQMRAVRPPPSGMGMIGGMRSQEDAMRQRMMQQAQLPAMVEGGVPTSGLGDLQAQANSMAQMQGAPAPFPGGQPPMQDPNAPMMGA